MIRTLDELRDYMKTIKLMPESQGPEDSERVLGPVLDALEGWDEKDLAGLLVNVAMNLAVTRGVEGTEALREALFEVSDTLQERQQIWGNVN
jgi:hypothetical protein